MLYFLEFRPDPDFMSLRPEIIRPNESAVFPALNIGCFIPKFQTEGPEIRYKTGD